MNATIRTINSNSINLYNEVLNNSYLYENIIGNEVENISMNDIVASISDFDKNIINLALLYAAYVNTDTAIDGFVTLERAEYFSAIDKMAGNNELLRGEYMHAAKSIVDGACWMHAYKLGVGTCNPWTKIHGEDAMKNKFSMIIEGLFFNNIKLSYEKLAKRLTVNF